jgi:hypothetical protein
MKQQVRNSRFYAGGTRDGNYQPLQAAVWGKPPGAVRRAKLDATLQDPDWEIRAGLREK